jgi:hypothetical protein
MKFVEVAINKPLYGQMYYVRDTYIKQAVKQHIPLRITTPEGSGEYWPKDWMKDAKKMEKVFNFPNNPMILWGNYVKVGHKAELKGKEKKYQEAMQKYYSMSEEERFRKFYN